VRRPSRRWDGESEGILEARRGRNEELRAWNSRAVEAIRILDRIKVNREGGGNDLLFVFNLHIGMGEIDWREEGDPMINRI
jgi:hypothetical protein